MPKRESNYPLCRHTKPNRRLCNSPALIGSAFCYHHRKLHGTGRTAIAAGAGLSTNVLHPLHNAQSVRQALAMVLTGVASNRIHPKTAGKMLYALQMATQQLP